LAACAGPQPTTPAATAAATPATRGPAPVTASPAKIPGAGTRPPLCDAPQPARQDPYPFNRDAARRDATLGAGQLTGQSGYTGGIAWFEDLDAAELAWLLNEQYIDPHEAQNAAPTVWEIFGFLCAHSTVRAAGYVVSIDRPDYRTSIESIYGRKPDAGLRAAAQSFCTDAEATFDDRLECFWD
ncbi:hypothetical protein, partial [Dactylosporangium salmoneum]|uniref:hypothetical protein n=1 Tax=Dactylosporangium salmoneum TaxID=53361 RepID=UPI0031D8CC66